MSVDFSLIVAILSVLVTILIGFQIFSIIDLNQRFRRLENKVKKQYLVDIEKAKCDATGMSLAQLGLSQFYNDDYDNAIRSLFNALAILRNGSMDDFASDAYYHAIDLIYSIVQDERVIGASFSKEEKMNNIVTSSSIEETEKRDTILAFLYSAKVQEV